MSVFLPLEHPWHLGRFSQQNTWISFFKQEVLTQKYITASNISTFYFTWKDLKVSLVLSKEWNVGTCWVLHKSEGCFGYISVSFKVLITYSSPAETGNSPWSLSAQKKEAVLCTSLGCLGDDLHIKSALLDRSNTRWWYFLMIKTSRHNIPNVLPHKSLYLQSVRSSRRQNELCENFPC